MSEPGLEQDMRVEEQAQPPECDLVHWITSTYRYSKVHRVAPWLDADAALIPACPTGAFSHGRTAFAGVGQEGRGLAAAAATGRSCCSKCWATLPAHLRGAKYTRGARSDM